MSTFDAGAVEASLTLDRTLWKKSLDAARAQAKRFEDRQINVKLELDREDFKAIIAELAKEAITVKVEPDLDNGAMDHVKDKLDDIEDNTLKPEVQPDVDTKWASTVLNWLTRRRTVDIFANVNAASLAFARARLNNLGTIVMRLSGAELVIDRLRRMRDWLADIDDHAIQFGKRGIIFSNLSSIVGVLLGNIITLGTSLGALGGLLLPLSATIGALATTVSTLFIAFRGWDEATGSMLEFKNALEALTPAWDKVQSAVKESFWDGLAAKFTEFADHIFPVLAEGLGMAATALNGFASQLLDSLIGIDQDVYVNMFENTAQAITIAKGAIDPLVSAFETLGTIGSEQLERLAGWVVTLSGQFDAWVQRNNDNGNFSLWIENAVTAFDDLGRVLYATGGIIGGLSDAMKAAGGTTLATLADTLERIHGIIDSPAFQTGLTTIFEGMKNATGALVDSLGAIGDMLAATAPSINAIFTTSGEALANFITNLSVAFSNPLFQGGLVTFFDGVKVALDAVGGVLPAISGSLGLLFDTLGTFLASVGPSLGVMLEVAATLFAQLAPIIDTLVVALTPLVTSTLVLLGNILQAIAPLFTALMTVIQPLVDFVTQFVTPAIQAISDGFAAWQEGGGSLAAFMETLVPVIVNGITGIITGFITMLPTILTTLLGFVPTLVQTGITVFSSLLTALITVLPSLLSTIIGFVPVLIETGITLFTALATALVDVLPTLLTTLTDTIISVAMMLVEMLPTLLDGAIQLFMALANAIITILPVLIDILFTQVLPALLKALVDMLPTLLNSAIEFFYALIDAVITILPQLINIIIGDVIPALIYALLDSIPLLLRAAVSLFMALLNALLELTPTLLGLLFSLVMGIVSGIIESGPKLFAAAINFFAKMGMGLKDIWDKEIWPFVTGIPDKIIGIFDKAKDWLFNAGKNIIEGAINGIKDGFQKVKDTLGSLTDMLPDWKGPAAKDRVILKKPAMLIMGGFVNSIKDQIPDVRAAMQDVTAALGLDATLPTPQLGLTGGYGTVGTGAPTTAQPQVIFQEGAVKVTTKSDMSAADIGRNVAAKIGSSLLKGTVPTVPPVKEDTDA